MALESCTTGLLSTLNTEMAQQTNGFLNLEGVVDMTNKLHDDHYAAMDVEPMTVMEQRIAVPGHLSPVESLHVATALQYLMRAGLKEGQPWRKDVQKAQNHLHRALTGDWLGAPTTVEGRLKGLPEGLPEDEPRRNMCKRIVSKGGTTFYMCSKTVASAQVRCIGYSVNEESVVEAVTTEIEWCADAVVSEEGTRLLCHNQALYHNAESEDH